MRGLFFGSSVKYVDASRIALIQILILKNIYFKASKISHIQLVNANTLGKK